MSLFMDFEGTIQSPSAAASAIAKLADIHSVNSILEHNSMVVYLAGLADVLAAPAKVATAHAAGATGYDFATYYGYPPNVGLASGTKYPIFGSEPAPTTDPERLMWWQALEMIMSYAVLGSACLCCVAHDHFGWGRSTS